MWPLCFIVDRLVKMVREGGVGGKQGEAAVAKRISCVAACVAVPARSHFVNVPHVRQQFHWDCGLACVLMVLRTMGIGQIDIQHLVDLCSTTSVWTVDLAYLLKRFSVSFRFFTVTVGANPKFSTETFYKVLINRLKHYLAKPAGPWSLFLFLFCDNAVGEPRGEEPLPSGRGAKNRKREGSREATDSSRLTLEKKHTLEEKAHFRILYKEDRELRQSHQSIHERSISIPRYSSFPELGEVERLAKLWEELEKEEEGWLLPKAIE